MQGESHCDTALAMTLLCSSHIGFVSKPNKLHICQAKSKAARDCVCSKNSPAARRPGQPAQQQEFTLPHCQFACGEPLRIECRSRAATAAADWQRAQQP